jgi:glycerophosphoryl diester phosphodiesterase
MFPISVPPHFSVVAHRGASGYAPENTMAAFELACRMGVAEIELDVQLSADGVVVVCHDPVLGRFGYPDVRIDSTPASRLMQLDMGSYFSPYLHGDAHMPALTEVLDGFGVSVTYHIELKSGEPELPAAVYRLLAERDLHDNCIIISFLPEQLARMKDVNAEMRVGWLVESLDEQTLGLARELDLLQLNPRVSGITAERVKQAHAIVHEVQPWGLGGSRTEFARDVMWLVECCCDGATVDWPDRLVGART